MHFHVLLLLRSELLFLFQASSKQPQQTCHVLLFMHLLLISNNYSPGCLACP